MKYFIFIFIIMATSCLKQEGQKTKVFENQRTPASELSSEITVKNVEEMLLQLHYYHLMAQKQLKDFDDQMPSSELSKIYQGPSYLKLMILKGKISDIEVELENILATLMKARSPVSQKKLKLIQKEILQFSLKSKIHFLAASSFITGPEATGSIAVVKRGFNLEQELAKVKDDPQFSVFEKNIEHLSYMILQSNSHFQEESLDRDNGSHFTGEEFPSKTWAVTFNNGREKINPEVLKNLQKRKISATFFQALDTKSQGQSFPLIDLQFSQYVELGSYPFAAGKISNLTSRNWNNEVFSTAKDLSKIGQKKTRFFRFPYLKIVKLESFNQDLTQISWNVDALDWVPQEPQKIVARTLSLMKKTRRESGIIMFHKTHQRTVMASEEIMNYLKQNNRRVCKLNEIISQIREAREVVCSQK